MGGFGGRGWVGSGGRHRSPSRVHQSLRSTYRTARAVDACRNRSGRLRNKYEHRRRAGEYQARASTSRVLRSTWVANSVGYLCQLRTGHVLMSNLERPRPRNTGHIKSVAARNRWKLETVDVRELYNHKRFRTSICRYQHYFNNQHQSVLAYFN